MLGVEKYIRNVVDDVVSSQGVVVMNVLVSCGVVGMILCDAFFCKLVGINIREKWEIQK